MDFQFYGVLDQRYYQYNVFSNVDFPICLKQHITERF